jgi:glycine/D-amino acid oxidase-like deaminating enzyme
MDLKSGYPFWAVKNGLMYAYPALREDLACDVAVIGGGITGALMADELVRHGHGVVVLEQRDIGWGSTAASTALLQYEIDTHMTDLAKEYGEDAAALAYRACASAVDGLRQLASGLGPCDFSMARSLYYASKRRHRDDLREEFELRRRHGFVIEWLERGELRERFGFDAPVALLSKTAAQVDPYCMAHRLFARVHKLGGEIFDRTTVADLATDTRGVTLRTDQGFRVRAGHVVLAAGYASQKWLKARVARNRSSYAFVTDPVDGGVPLALRKTLLWESARPYLYLRSTRDSRMLIGGEDDAMDIPARRDARVGKKVQALLRKIGKLYPQLSLVPAFSWAGTFAETRDGLPFFGPHRQYGPRVHFAMAYGGNGITYSMIGAGLLRAAIERRRHPLAALFGFARLD